MYRLSNAAKLGSKATNVLIAVGLAALLLLGSFQAKRILDWFGNVEVQKTPLGFEFLKPSRKIDRRIINLPAIPSHRLEEAVKSLALNIYHEARGEDAEGMVAVGIVTLNRVRNHRFPNSVVGVVKQGGETLHKCQFSWWCDGKSDIPKDKASWRIAQEIAVGILSGEYVDPTEGALSYYNPNKTSPCWGKSKSLIKDIGSHRYYGDIPWPERKRLCLSGKTSRANFLYTI